VQREGWNAQVTAAEQNARDEAARLTIDAAMLLVDAALHATGSTHACTRDDVVAAFAHLTDPLVARAVWLDEKRDGIAVLYRYRSAEKSLKHRSRHGFWRKKSR